VSAQAVRDAVQSGRYAEAARLFEEWARSASPADLPAMAELLYWVRSTVVCAAAHDADRLAALRDELHVLSAYAH
jgi:hypothetical protein